MQLRTFLRGLPPWAKALIPASIGLGVACVWIGHIGDTHKFWDDQNFAANLFSTFTGALFGIPFVVVLITWFTTSQTTRMSNAAERTSAEVLARNAWHDFAAAIANHVAIVPPTTLRAAVNEVSEACRRVSAKLAAVNARNPNAFHVLPSKRVAFEWGTDGSGAGYREDFLIIRDEMVKVRTAIQPITSRVQVSGSTTANYNREWASLRGKWQFLNVHVRARLLSVDPEWMPAAAETEFVYRLDERLSPLSPVVVAMANQLLPFMNAVKGGLESQSAVELAKCLTEPSVRVFKPDAFAGVGNTAAGILEEIQAAVHTVDTAGWPKH